MRSAITSRLEALVKLRHTPPQEVIAEAVEIGVSKLYLESVLGLYLRKKLSRNKAIRLVGRDAVELGERQHQAAQKDIAWGLGVA